MAEPPLRGAASGGCHASTSSGPSSTIRRRVRPSIPPCFRARPSPISGHRLRSRARPVKPGTSTSTTASRATTSRRPPIGCAVSAERTFLAGLAVVVLGSSGCAPVQAEVGSGLPPAPDAGRCDPLAPLRLYYRNSHPADPSNSIDYIVKVENATGSPLPLTSLKVRYFFTNELVASSKIEIFYAGTCCSNKIVGFVTDIPTSLTALPANPAANRSR